ncbi:unnamed protein product [Clavelina lepadiformis]|uniref:Ig-like domain-containing protein n=1 Tax=Clavelina lepadiformis TaxID=159417 RepID=A0ABP0FDJ8_CLALP
MIKQKLLVVVLLSFFGLSLQGAFTSVSLKPLSHSVTAVLGEKPSISAKLVFAVRDPRGEISGSLCDCDPDECKQTWKYAGQAITIPQPRLKALCEEKNGSRNLTLTINPVKLSDQGQYTCGLYIPINIFLEDARITLNVNQLPNISIKRIKERAKEATLTKVAACYANLSKPPPEMWFQDSNGKKIYSEDAVETKDCGNGLTNSTLYLTKRFTRSDSDLNYFCKVKHVNHTVYSRGLGSVEVLYPPTVTLEDESLSSVEINIIEAGEQFSAKCLATGNPPPDVVWTFTPDPMPIDPNLTKPAPPNDGSLPSNFILEDKVKITTNALASTNNGTFRCQASNQIGSPASVSFKLGVFVKSTPTTPALTTPNYPPTVTLEDESLSSAEVNIIEAGEQFSAKCLATGNPPPDVVWTFTPDPMPIDPKSTKPAPPHDGSLPSNFILEDKVKITTNALASTNNGTFRCQASNQIKSPASVSFKLGVFVKSTSTTPAPTTPNYPPTVTLEDESLSSAEVNIIEAGEQFSAKCLATGNPPPDVVWTFTPDPMPIDPKSTKPAPPHDGSLPSNFILEDKVKITTNALQSTNNGTFRCQASNQIGSPASVSFQLGVFVKSAATTAVPTTPNYPPTVTLEDESLLSVEVNIIEAGEQFSAKCLATGNPPPDVVWTFTPDPMPIDPKSKKSVLPNDGSLPKNFIILQDQVTIVTNALDTTNNGSFECRAYNKIGSPATVSFKLGVFEIPTTLPSAASKAAEKSFVQEVAKVPIVTIIIATLFIAISFVVVLRWFKEKSAIKSAEKIQQGQNYIDESVTSDGSWPLDDATETTVLTRHTEFKYVETVF